MELLYALLWKGCSWFLLSFLVSRFISLIVVCSSDDDNDDLASGFVSEEGINERLMRVHDSGSKTETAKRVEFDGESTDFAGQVNFVKEGFSHGVMKEFEIGEFLEELVDQEKVGGFQGEVGGRRIGHGVGVEVGCGAVVDDAKAVESSSNVYDEGEISGQDRVEGGLTDEEDWEGVERTELEKKFARAMSFVEGEDTEGRFLKAGTGDLMMQFYGLQKVAMEGTCHKPQPMALKLSARAKWNAWQRLGNMTREDAMEQYMNLLSDNIPDWMEEHSSVDPKSRSSREAVYSFPEAS